MAGLSVTATLFLAFLLLILLIAWILLPFAMFGLKPLVRELIDEQRKTNQMLERMSRDTVR